VHVIGISGLDNSVPFKRRELPGLPERCYRFAQGFDSAAALVGDAGVIAAAAEERFTGEKTTGRLPAGAIRYCLDTAGVELGEVAAIAHGFCYEPPPAQGRDELARRRYAEVYAPAVQVAALERAFPGIDMAGRFVPVPHHLAHAASAFYPSGFEESLVLVADGMGETESTSVMVGTGGDLRLLRKVPALHSLGLLYGLFTHYLGFVPGTDEYKVMGLAAGGDPRRFFPALCALLRLRDRGEFTVPLLARDVTALEQETHEGVLRELSARFGPPREPGVPLERRHVDLAAALQAALETALLHVLRHFRAETGLRRLCLAGGVALNCTANGKIHRSRLFDRIFVQPAAGDDGTALGAALYVRRQRAGPSPNRRMTMPYWGPEYSEAEMVAALDGCAGCRVTRHDDTRELTAEVADMLAAGLVCAWFQGRMEFGPRALGCRSILADPRDVRMRDHVNGLIKEREAFRPFAPVVATEEAGRWFQIPAGEEELFAHMLVVAPVRPERREQLGAVTHVDGSARVQTIRRQDNPLYWQLIADFGAVTGVPVLLNTSFNLRGQPIVRSPADAVATFLRSQLDALVIGRHLVTRER
jgi:carbamoyltransferase